MRELLDKRECKALKGVSILLIMWHNLVLMMDDVVKVNEHTYNVQYTYEYDRFILAPKLFDHFRYNVTLGTHRSSRDNLYQWLWYSSQI